MVKQKVTFITAGLAGKNLFEFRYRLDNPGTCALTETDQNESWTNNLTQQEDLCSYWEDPRREQTSPVAGAPALTQTDQDESKQTIGPMEESCSHCGASR